MNKKRILVVVGGAVLLLSIVLVALGFNFSPRAEGSSIPFVGMGEVQRFDASQSKAHNVLVVGNMASGMGEVQRYDAVQSSAVKGLVVERIYTGMGDLHRYESSQE